MITNINFPPQLPCFLREDYKVSYGNDIQRTGMVSGRARQRREFEEVPGQVTVSLHLTDAEAQYFEAWYKYTLKSINWFNTTIRTPFGMVSEVCRFTRKYDGGTLVGNKWKYTFQLEIYEQQTISSEWMEFAPEYILMGDIFDIAMNQEWPEA